LFAKNVAKMSENTKFHVYNDQTNDMLDDEKVLKLLYKLIVFKLAIWAQVSIVKNKKQVPSHIRKILKPFEWKEPMES